MKKMFIVMIVVAMAVAACGGKKAAPAGPTGTGSGDMGSAAGSGEMGGSGEGSAAGGGEETPAPSM